MAEGLPAATRRRFTRQRRRYCPSLRRRHKNVGAASGPGASSLPGPFLSSPGRVCALLLLESLLLLVEQTIKRLTSSVSFRSLLWSRSVAAFSQRTRHLSAGFSPRKKVSPLICIRNTALEWRPRDT